MITSTVEVKVYTPAEGKAIKLTQNGKIVTYLIIAYYELPTYNYDVEEVDIAEAEKYYAKANNKIRKFSKMFRR